MAKHAMDRLEAFLRTHVAKHPKDLVAFTAEGLGLASDDVVRGVQDLIESGTFEQAPACGGTSELRWKPALRCQLVPGLEEDRLWRDHVEPRLAGVPENVRKLLYHGTTEMVNNVIDHSEASVLVIVVQRLPDEVEICVEDDGIGIFEKLQRLLGLENPQHVALELWKGKLTTAPEHHTGEGIFFTSWMCDKFLIWSGTTVCGHVNREGWNVRDEEFRRGTTIRMVVSLDSRLSPREVFEKFAPSQDEAGFSRTVIQVGLVRENGDDLISRSQARRLMARCELFQEITLDFQEVENVGPAFADEIFRVFARAHAETALHVRNAKPGILAWIQKARAHGAG